MKRRILLPCLAALALAVPQAGRAASPASQALLERGVSEIVFAERAFGRDGHWYANFGYFFNGPHNSAYMRGARLMKLDVKSGRTTVLLEDKTGSIRDPNVHARYHKDRHCLPLDSISWSSDQISTDASAGLKGFCIRAIEQGGTFTRSGA